MLFPSTIGHELGYLFEEIYCICLCFMAISFFKKTMVGVPHG